MLCRLTRAALRVLDHCRLTSTYGKELPSHQRTGRRGEEDAYFYLRQRGYVMVARNYRSPRRRGEIDLVGWDREVLCFIEVKTRSSREVKPAEAAVDREKRRELAAMAREYLRGMPEAVPWRFDVVSVYYESDPANVEIELFKNAFAVA
ncbi:MAG TPA: YraN family protein [Terriglobales bacterium]|nr:YraN family protein [Terriglobales bacterium]